MGYAHALLVILNFLSFVPRTYAWSVDRVPNPISHGSYVSNPDQILSPEEEQSLKERLSRIEQETSNEVSIVALKTIGSEVPKTFAVDLFQKWGIGKKGKDNGLLILLLMDQRRIEFEVGYGLEGSLTDYQCSMIIQEQMIPKMRNGQTAKALASALDEIESIFRGEPSLSTSSHAKERVIVGMMDSIPLEEQSASSHHVKWRGDDIGNIMIWGFMVLTIFLMVILPITISLKKNGLRQTGVGIFKVIASILCLGLIVNLTIFTVRFISSLDFKVIAFLVYATINLGHILYSLRKWQDEIALFVAGKREVLPSPKRFLMFSLFFFYAWRLYISKKREFIKAKGFHLVSEKEEDIHLTPSQILEEKIGANEYDVFINQNDQSVRVEKNVIPLGKYSECSSCSTKSEFLESDKIMQAATYSSSGRGLKTYHCLHCDKRRQVSYTIPQKSKSSGGSSGSGPGGGSSRSSFGGGRSGGGGAGGSW